MTGVRTESNGEGPDRRVQIIPVKAGQTPPQNPPGI
jgi:hypothetical protein